MFLKNVVEYKVLFRAQKFAQKNDLNPSLFTVHKHASNYINVS